MDEELDEAVRALAEMQQRQRIRTIILTSDLMSGDVVASVMGPHSHKTTVYARVEGPNGRLVRVLNA
jgi:uncharacterized protein with ACT and thioredoxin-like domain